MSNFAFEYPHLVLTKSTATATVWKTPTLQYTSWNSRNLWTLSTMPGTMRSTLTMSRTVMVMRTAVRRLRRSRFFRFLTMTTRKRKLRTRARTERTDQPPHHQSPSGWITWNSDGCLSKNDWATYSQHIMPKHHGTNLEARNLNGQNLPTKPTRPTGNTKQR